MRGSGGAAGEGALEEDSNQKSTVKSLSCELQYLFCSSLCSEGREDLLKPTFIHIFSTPPRYLSDVSSLADMILSCVCFHFQTLQLFSVQQLKRMDLSCRIQTDIQGSGIILACCRERVFFSISASEFHLSPEIFGSVLQCLSFTFCKICSFGSPSKGSFCESTLAELSVILKYSSEGGN